MPARALEAKIIHRGRGPEIAGTRITVFDVLDYLKHGWHRDRIAALFRLSSRDVQAAMDYIESHREEVAVEYRKILARHGDHRYPPETQVKVDRCREAAARRLVGIRERGRLREAGRGGGRDAEDLG